MDEQCLNVLHIEDNPRDALLVMHMLRDREDFPVRLTHAGRLAEGLGYLAGDRFDLVLLDLDLPDATGIEAVAKVHAQAPGVPIIVLTDRDGGARGSNAVWAGAQDYLTKGELTRSLLAHAIRYAIGRHGFEAAARRQSGMDPATGFRDRQAFMAMAQRDLSLALRRGARVALLVVHTGGLLRLAGSMEPERSREVFTRFASSLRDSLRGTDLIGRVSPDDFAVLALDVSTEGERIVAGRVFGSLSSVTDDPECLGMRVATVGAAAGSSASADALLAKAMAEVHERSSGGNGDEQCAAGASMGPRGDGEGPLATAQ